MYKRLTPLFVGIVLKSVRSPYLVHMFNLEPQKAFEELEHFVPAFLSNVFNSKNQKIEGLKSSEYLF